MSGPEWAQIGATTLFAFVFGFIAPSIANDVRAGWRRGREILRELSGKGPN